MAKHDHKITDPVCGTTMKPKEVQNRSEQGGQTYYFCSTACKEQFDKTPERFATKKVA